MFFYWCKDSSIPVYLDIQMENESFNKNQSRQGDENFLKFGASDYLLSQGKEEFCVWREDLKCFSHSGGRVV